MLFTSPVYSQVSGSIAGITYAHGRSGMITKARRKPTNPDSERQRTVRTAIRTLAPYWGQVLTTEMRAQWSMYASNVPIKNALGQTIFLTGSNHFIRCNVPRIQAGIEILEDAPANFNLGTFTAPTIDQFWSNFDRIMIGFTITDEWVSTVGGFMLVYAGRPTNVGQGFFKSPWRYVGKVVGQVIAPATPQSFAAPWPWAADNIAWIKCRIIQADGRMSLPIILGPEAIAEGP